MHKTKYKFERNGPRKNVETLDKASKGISGTQCHPLRVDLIVNREDSVQIKIEVAKFVVDMNMGIRNESTKLTYLGTAPNI